MKSYMKWEAAIYNTMAKKLDCTYSDAQAVVDVHEHRLNQWFNDGITSSQVVRIILNENKAADKQRTKEEQREERNWNKMIARMTELGALVQY